MCENIIINKVSSLVIILIFVCSGLLIIVPSTLVLPGADAEANQMVNYGFLSDSTPPTSQITLPGNNSVLITLDSIKGTASDFNGSGITKVEILLKRSNDNLYWNGTNWSSFKSWVIVSGTLTWSYINLPGNWTIGAKYRIQSRATDNASNVETPSWGTIFYINWGTIINVPVNNSYINSVNSISGIATPLSNANISKVEIYIKYYTSNFYWNGTGWNNTLIWLLTTGTTSWMYNSSSVTWNSNTKYLICSKATDNKSNVENPGYGNVFIFDNIKPSSTINFPANNSVLETINKITGSAIDTGGSGLSYIKISIKRNSDGKYYNGWYWVSKQTWLMASGTTNWIYNIYTNQTWLPGTYQVESIAVDKATNVESLGFGNIFTIKGILSSTINMPWNNSYYKVLNTISGTATASLGTSISKVELSIKRNFDTKYWSGSGWKSTQTWLLTSGTTSWSYNSNMVAWNSGNTYLIRSRATDNINNVENPSYGNVFIFDNIKPSSTINSPANNSVLNSLNTVTGNASDTGGAGIWFVEISLMRYSDNFYWNGYNWTSTQTWLRNMTYGTTNWIFLVGNTSLLITAGKYLVQSRARDKANNIETPSFGNIFNITSSSTTSSSVNYPANNAYLNAVNMISGSATLNSRSGIKQVEISIRQTSNDYYWDGINWKIGEYWLLATGTESWSYDSSSVSWLTDTYYNIRSRAIDNLDNIELPEAGITYMFDNKPPQNLDIQINDAAEYTKSESVILSLNAEDSGSGIAQIGFSSDSIEWSTWKPFDTSLSFELPKGDGGKDVHFRVKDKAENIAMDSDTIILDSTQPQFLSMKINENKLYTNSRVIEIAIEIKDIGSDIIKIAFSDDGIQWSNWEDINRQHTRVDNFLLNKQYTLPPGDGPKIIYYKVQDSAGNIEEYVYDTIILDTTPPHSLSILINNGAVETNSPSVSLTLNAIDDTSGVHQMSFSTDDITWSSWEEFVNLKSYTLPSGDGEKIIYFLIKDKAGNIAITVKSTIILKTAEPVIDTDDDGILDDNDAFPDDPAASVDSDEDNSPDHWNPGKSEKDSTTGLHLDAFPIDPAASIDLDGDDYPDCWNVGMSEYNSITGLKLDAYPNDPNRHTKKSTEPELGFGVILIIFVIVIIIGLILFSIIRTKHRSTDKSFNDNNNKMLRKMRDEIIYGTKTTDSELYDSEIIKDIEKRYKGGEISESTYQDIINIIHEK